MTIPRALSIVPMKALLGFHRDLTIMSLMRRTALVVLGNCLAVTDYSDLFFNNAAPTMNAAGKNLAMMM